MIRRASFGTTFWIRICLPNNDEGAKMPINAGAGKPADPAQLVNIPRLIASYYTIKPDAGQKTQRVAFGTSGHRGSSFSGSFNENHILAITQAICAYRKDQG